LEESVIREVIKSVMEGKRESMSVVHEMSRARRIIGTARDEATIDMEYGGFLFASFTASRAKSGRWGVEIKSWKMHRFIDTTPVDAVYEAYAILLMELAETLRTEREAVLVLGQRESDFFALLQNVANTNLFPLQAARAPKGGVGFATFDSKVLTLPQAVEAAHKAQYDAQLAWRGTDKRSTVGIPDRAYWDGRELTHKIWNLSVAEWAHFAPAQRLLGSSVCVGQLYGETTFAEIYDNGIYAIYQ
jgi:hypothetical protein